MVITHTTKGGIHFSINGKYSKLNKRKGVYNNEKVQN